MKTRHQTRKRRTLARTQQYWSAKTRAAGHVLSLDRDSAAGVAPRACRAAGFCARLSPLVSQLTLACSLPQIWDEVMGARLADLQGLQGQPEYMVRAQEFVDRFGLEAEALAWGIPPDTTQLVTAVLRRALKWHILPTTCMPPRAGPACLQRCV